MKITDAKLREMREIAGWTHGELILIERGFYIAVLDELIERRENPHNTVRTQPMSNNGADFKG